MSRGRGDEGVRASQGEKTVTGQRRHERGTEETVAGWEKEEWFQRSARVPLARIRREPQLRVYHSRARDETNLHAPFYLSLPLPLEDLSSSFSRVSALHRHILLLALSISRLEHVTILTISRSRSLRFSTFRSEGSRERICPRETLRDSSVSPFPLALKCSRSAPSRIRAQLHAQRDLVAHSEPRTARGCSFTAGDTPGLDPCRHDRRNKSHVIERRYRTCWIVPNNYITSLFFVSRYTHARARSRVPVRSDAARRGATSRIARDDSSLPFSLSLFFLRLCHANARARSHPATKRNTAPRNRS